MPLYDKQPHMSQILTNAVSQRNKLFDWRREVISRPIEEWVGHTMTTVVEDVEATTTDALHSDGTEEFQLRPSFLGQFFVKTSKIGANLSRYCELILASRMYTVIRLVVAPIAFFNLAYLVIPLLVHFHRLG